MNSADLVLLIGYDRIEGIEPSMFLSGKTKKVISIDTVSNTSPEHFKPDLEIVGNITRSLYELNRHHYTPRIYDLTRRELATEKSQPEDMTTAYPVRPEWLVDALADARGDSIITTDVGWHKQAVGLLFPARYPNRIVYSNGLSHMGIGVPAALAAKLAHPDEDVVAVVGDGGFHMSMAELETSGRYNIPITIIVVDDGALGLVRTKQRRLADGEIGTEIRNPDFIKLARSYEMHGYRVSSPRELPHILEKTKNPSQTVLIDVPTSYERVSWG